MDPDKVFGDILLAINKMSQIPLAKEDQETFELNVCGLSEWVARGGYAPENAPEDLGSWLSGAKAAIFLLRGYPRP